MCCVYLTWTGYMIAGYVNAFSWIIKGPFKFNVRWICINAASYLRLFLFRNTVNTRLIWAAWRCIYFFFWGENTKWPINNEFRRVSFVFTFNLMLYPYMVRKGYFGINFLFGVKSQYSSLCAEKKTYCCCIKNENRFVSAPKVTWLNGRWRETLKFSNEQRKQSQVEIIIVVVVVVVGVVDVVNQISVKHMLTYFSFNIYEACKLCVQRPAVKKKSMRTTKYISKCIRPMIKWNSTLTSAHVESVCSVRLKYRI